MRDFGVQRILEHYKVMLVDYCELLDFTRSFEQRIKHGFWVEDIMGFVEEREGRIIDLQQKEAESITLREVVCREFGLSAFTLKSLSTKFSIDSLKVLSEVMAESKKVIVVIQEIDARLSQTIQTELEVAKLELHRFKKAQRIHHAYQTENEREARFIDKTK